MLRNILLGTGVFAALFSVLIFSGKIPLGNKADKPQGQVVLWGTLPQHEMDNLIKEFNPKAKTYKVIYAEVKESVFTQKLTDELANGSGPDMILAPHQIILSQTSRLYPFPVQYFSEKKYKDTYVDGASIFYNPAGSLALPVAIEPMVLFYNRTLLSKHGIVNPPTYWDELSVMAPKLTLTNSKGQFVESAVSIGTPNTPYAKDILMSIVTQLGQTPVLTQYTQEGSVVNVLANSPTSDNGEVRPLSTALRFFTQFADPTKSTYSWNPFVGKADDIFVAEKLAMYIGYSGELNSLRARNPKGDFEMANLPQTRGYNTFSTGARVYGIATLRTTKNPTVSLQIEADFSSAGISPSIAAITGGVPALRAYASTQGLNDVVSRGMLVARPWYDNFPNESNNYISSMIFDVINNRKDINEAVSTFVSRLQDLYNPY